MFLIKQKRQGWKVRRQDTEAVVSNCLKKHLSVAFNGLVFGLCLLTVQSATGPGRLHAQRAEGRPKAAMVARSILEQRADRMARQDHLLVDFYRIYRKLAYPLPVTSIAPHEIQVEGIARYPWEIWMIWKLEDRVHSLAWSGQWSNNEVHRSLVERDLLALARWPGYNVWEEPHLSVGHIGRLMAVALDEWSWLSEETRSALIDACRRLVSAHASWFKESRAHLQDFRHILDHPDRRSLIHNIPVIATIGLAMAAGLSEHPLQAQLDEHVEAVILAELELRSEGVSEAISYDGYILDFVVDWLAHSRREPGRNILKHPELKRLMNQPVILATPGKIETFAPLNDVEPIEMPYHAAVHAKLLDDLEDRTFSWFLERYPKELLPADSLAALATAESWPAEEEPRAGAFRGLYAHVLRTGWSPEDLAVVISASESSSGHIQRDNGSLVIGKEGRWVVDDPGYQQYLAGEEREFTIGATAHNFPVINGEAQMKRQLGDQLCRQIEGGLLESRIDLSEGYPEELGLEQLIRQVWVLNDDYVVVADQIRSSRPLETIQYNWHAHAETGVWVDPRGRGLIYTPQTRLWLESPEHPLSGEDVKRLPGSRGQMTFQSIFEADQENVVWWIFSFDEPARFQLSPDQQSLVIKGRTLSLP